MLAHCPAGCRLDGAMQAYLAGALSVGLLQVLQVAAQDGAALWSTPLAGPDVFSFAARQETWALFW